MALPARIDDLVHQIVSLTTTSEIRYEGRLVSFDVTNNSITLREVRKFGTEDRRAPVPVPADSKKYDFIVFHYNGIQSLSLKRGPNTLDPAIMSMSGGHGGYISRQQQLNHQLPRMQSNIRNVDVRSLMRSGGRGNSAPRNRDQSRDRRRFDDRQPRQNERHVSFSIGQPKRSESRGRMAHIPHVPRSALGRIRNTDGKKKEGQTRRSVSVTLSQPGKFSKPKKTEKFEEDFDFDKELQKFDKLTLTDGSGDDKEKNAGDMDDLKKVREAYNPDNFFDNLTSMKETEKPKRSRKDEKEANRETFGVGHIRPKMKFSDRRFHGRFNLRSAHRRATAAM